MGTHPSRPPEESESPDFAVRLVLLHEQLEELGSALLRQLDAAPALHSVTSQTITAILRARRQRAAVFGDDLFADPAWDILLVLYEAALSQRRVATSELGYAIGIPQTTSLRWIDKLEQSRWASRQADPFDARRVHVKLSPRALEAMSGYFRFAMARLSV